MADRKPNPAQPSRGRGRGSTQGRGGSRGGERPLSKREIETQQNIQHKKQLREQRENLLQRKDEKRKKNEGVEVSTTTIRNELGVFTEIKDLSVYWITRPTLVFLNFLPIDLSLAFDFSSKNARLQLSDVGYDQETLLETLSFLNEDLSLLLRLRYNIFWSHVIYNKSLQNFLDAFLRFAHRAHDDIQLLSGRPMREDWKEDSVYLPILEKVFRVYVRMSAPSEGPHDHFEPAAYGDFLYKNKLLDVPKLMDICLIYGKTNEELVKKMVSTAFSLQLKLKEDLLNAAVLSYHRLEALLTTRDASYESWRETRGFVLDVVVTLFAFLNVRAEAAEAFFPVASQRNSVVRANPSLRDTSFFSHGRFAFVKVLVCWFNTVERPSPDRKKEDSVVENVVQDVILEVVRLLFKAKIVPALRAGESSRPKEFTEETDSFLDLILSDTPSPSSSSSSSSSSRSFFAALFNLYPLLFDELVSLKRIPKDFINVPKLIEAIKVAEKLRSDRPRTTSSTCVPTPVQESPRDAKESCALSQIVEVFPELPQDFLLRCLRFYKQDASVVISRLLDDSLDSSLKKEPPRSIAPPSTGQILLPTSLREKRKAKITPTSREEKEDTKARILQQYLFENEFEYEYEDEYDDSYEEFQNFGVESEHLEDDERPQPVSSGPHLHEEDTESSDGSRSYQNHANGGPSDGPGGRGRGSRGPHRYDNHSRKTRSAKKRGY